MAKLTAAELKALPESQFGLPKARKFPMPDETHVTKAIQFFRYAKPEERKELDANINRRAKELGMKVKVQPSSAFFKYCSPNIKAGMKENAVIREFHIGQLSPIVPLEPEVMKINFSDTKTGGPLERLRKIWDSKKSLEEKNSDSYLVLHDVLEHTSGVNTNLEIAFQGILEANYMLTSSADFKEINRGTLNQWIDFFNPMERMENLKMRTYDVDYKSYNTLLDGLGTLSVDEIVGLLKNIHSLGILSAALCHINYSSAISYETKKQINGMFRTDIIRHGFPINLNLYETDKGPEQLLNMALTWQMLTNDTQMAAIQQFIRFVDIEHAHKKVSKLIRMIAKERASRSIPPWNNIDPVVDAEAWPICLFHLQNAIDDHAIEGYYVDKDNPKFTFVTDRGRICLAYPIFSQGQFVEFFLVTIWDEGRKELFDEILQYFMTPKGRISLMWNELKIERKAMPKLENADFTNAYKGIQISTNGNISFLLGIDDSWKEKYQLCQKELTANAKNEEWAEYKNNLCFLFGLITLIHKRYEVPNAEETFGKLDYNDAMSTLPNAIRTFVMGIRTISKVEKDFNFVLYFLETGYNDKLHIFQQETETDVSSEVSIAYRYIMG